jgi:uncharacterized protein (DUF4213/DUF364 family)
MGYNEIKKYENLKITMSLLKELFKTLEKMIENDELKDFSISLIYKIFYDKVYIKKIKKRKKYIQY